jgi:hypothetical protein
MGEFTPKMAKFTPKGVIRVLILIHPKMVKNIVISKIVQIRPLIARSKNLAKADLMSPPPELSIFPPAKSPSFVGSGQVRPVKWREEVIAVQ